MDRWTLLIKLTGGSATMAVDVLKSRGVPEDHILFINLIASPEGIDGFAKRFPSLRVVTAFIDQVCNANYLELL
jgi:uracil phosphoribosyltransferase